jgi:2-dehydro-3-deoxygluconokinase
MIVAIGEPMMVFNGPADAPISVGASLRGTFAGAESNVAIGLARLGHAVRYLTVLGDDAFGHTIARTLRGEGVDVSAVRFSAAHPTGVMFKQRWGGDEPEVMYYRKGSAFAQGDGQTFDAALWRDARVIYLTGITPALSAGCLGLVRRVLADAAARGVPVWLDPNYRRKLWEPEAFRETIAAMLPQVDTVLPGLAEGRMLTGKTEPGEIACALMGLGAKNVVLKADGDGAMVYGPAGLAAAVARLDIGRVVDPIGAGDAFATGYLSGHLDGLSAQDALARAHAAAAMVCMTQGDWEGLPDRARLARFLGGGGAGAHR